jgi:hypothetical protein
VRVRIETEQVSGVNLQVGHVYGSLRLLCEVVGNQADVGKRPAKDVGKNKDGGILGVACHIGLALSKRGLLAGGLAVPLEAGFAVFTRHDRVCMSW